MHESLEESTQTKARELARQITVAHDLDPEIQEELYGHIEDKLIAYMSGEEAVTEEDALILVREHFGDTRTVRALMLGVHGGRIEVGLTRRILAITMTMLAVQTAIHVIRPFIVLPLKLSGIAQNPTGGFLTIIGIGLGSVLLSFALLKYWRKEEQSANPPWYVRLSTRRLLYWLGGVLALFWLVPTLTVVPDVTVPADMAMYFWVLRIGSLLIPAASCALWLWWTEAGARPLPTNLFLGALWIVVGFIKTLYPAKLFLVLGATSHVSGATSLVQGNLGATPCALFLGYGGAWSSMDVLLHVLRSESVLALVLCLIAAAIHSRLLGRRGPNLTESAQP